MAKMGLLVCVSAVALGAVGGVAIWNLVSINSSWAAFNKQVEEKHTYLLDVRASMGYGGTIHNFKNYLLRIDKAELQAQDRYLETLMVKTDEVVAAVDSYRSAGRLTASEQADLDQVAAMVNEYRDAAFTIEELAAQGRTVEEIDTAVKIDDAPYLEALVGLSDALDAETVSSTRKFASQVRSAAVMVVLVAVGGLGLVIFGGVFFGRRWIVVPVTAVTAAARDVAAGDFSRLPDADSSDEIGELARTFSEMAIARRDTETHLAAANRRLDFLANRDSLTGLPSRILFTDRLTKALLRLERVSGGVCVLFIDLDRFKYVNDTFGHDMGDRLLVEVSRRFTAVARTVDTVARFGGDEFTVLCEDIDADADAQVIGQRFLHSLDDPIEVDGRELVVSASIGIVRESNPKACVEDVVSAADAAMYAAKDAGRARCEFFTEDLLVRPQRYLAVESALKDAITEDRFSVYYQPIVDLASGRAVGVEALLRLADEDGSQIPAAEFIGVAEESGLIVEIGEWVLRRACRQVKEWNETLGPESRLTVQVNLSARQLAEPDILRTVGDALDDSGLDPSLLCLELTETTMMRDMEAAIDTVDQLKSLGGIHVAVDDFGTAYSTLVYLQRFPIDQLKIERAFIGGLGLNGTDDAIIDGLIHFAHRLDLTVVAEGIETDTQYDRLRLLGCDLGQGYLLARPQPPEQLREQLGDTFLPNARPLSETASGHVGSA